MACKDCTIHIANLSKYCNKTVIRLAFEKFGIIRDIHMVNSSAFVEYDNPRDARYALQKLNGMSLMGSRISVAMLKDKLRYLFAKRTKYRVILRNLSSTTTRWNLKNVLRHAGDVCFVDVRYKNVGQYTDGVAEFRTRRDMEQA